MRPSSTIFDPGLERAAPWGRDLFTFVTSAAGYMMRTLQKPRKNKPSKRQVNHRRFLHNMIQRKFAEIEAANQQLTSALFTVDSETQRPPDAKSSHSSESEKNTKYVGETKTPKKHQDKENDVEPRKLNNIVVKSSKSHLNVKHFNHVNSKIDGQAWRAEHHLLSRSHFTSEREQLHTGPADSHVGFLEDGVINSPHSIEEMRPDSNTQFCTCSNEEEENSLGLSCFDISLTSLESPSSIDSFDFNVQTNGEKSARIQNITDSFELDVLENFLDFSEGTGRHTLSQPADRTDVGSAWNTQSQESQSVFRDTPAILNSLYEHQSEGDVTGSLQIGSLSEDSEWTSGDGSENNILYFGSSCNKGETKQTGATVDIYQHQAGLTALAGSWTQSDALKKSVQTSEMSNHSLTELGLSDQFQMKYWDQQIQEGQDQTQSVDAGPYSVLMDDIFEVPNLNPGYPVVLSASAHCRNGTLQDFSSYPGVDPDQSFPSFDGVAQSFPAPVQDLNPYPVSTPPLNDDWLFSNIVMEGDYASAVRSPGCTSCWRSGTKSNEYAVVLE